MFAKALTTITTIWRPGTECINRALETGTSLYEPIREGILTCGLIQMFPQGTRSVRIEQNTYPTTSHGIWDLSHTLVSYIPLSFASWDIITSVWDKSPYPTALLFAQEVYL